MAEKKTSLFSRLMEGREKDENYARSTLPTNRWQLFWDIIKGRIGKLMIINLLVAIFFLPIVAIFIMRLVNITSQGVLGPFSSSLGIGYPGIPDVEGVWETFMYVNNVKDFALIVLSSVLAAVGLAGGSYVIRNMIWTEGIFIANDFWKGIKKNFFVALEAALFFSTILFVDVLVNSYADILIVQNSGGSTAWFYVAKVCSIVVNVIAAFMSMWMISLGSNYNQGPIALIKNSFIMTIGTLPQTLVFGALALCPALLFMTGVSGIIAVAVVFYLILGFSYALLCWMSYTQWAFDKFVNPGMKGAKVGRGLYNPDAKKDQKESDEADAIHAYKLAVIAAGKSNLMSRPMKPIDDDYEVYELPETFSREDLQKLKDSKVAIAESQKEYEAEHKDDAKYVEYNKQFEEREKALQPEKDKKGKVKKKKPPKMLNE